MAEGTAVREDQLAEVVEPGFYHEFVGLLRPLFLDLRL